MYNKLFIPLQHSVGVVYFSIIMVVYFSITIYKREQGFRGKNGYNKIAEANCLNSGDEQACARNASALKTQQEKAINQQRRDRMCLGAAHYLFI